ncbi:enoyl-CoA hydratase/isomerase family protein [Corynebacterium hylobatis]|uniref:3-hydroxyisobutyryl-CoA hydrolase n=1 Tax=Corynebacterium hylobatis TaxID=1859290 RepID=A0A430I1C0_9CORY|nr:3-hydroxyisobutyryl-CoA hydrolase [Corynebacterium hylobatis]RSZ65649.1 enoyl-CoA hydratase/isomerase family protein [Corynebacterium hylobatis]
MTTQTETPVLVSVRHHTGVLELNRPRALNSLNPEMVEIITRALEEWRDDESVAQVLITSTSPKAFCAGGDVRHVREEILAGQEERADRFFSDEYAMNHLIAGYPKPYIAVLDGITMGGGLGVSAHGSHRVVTGQAWASMPEMAIGYITDVGISWASQRWPGSSPALGAFIGLTGYRLTAADMLYCGLATHMVADAAAFTGDVVDLGVEEALTTHATVVAEESRLAEWRESIEEVFSNVTWADIDAALATHADQDFVTAVRVLMAGGSPSAILATAELYAANRDAPDLRHGLDNEERLGELVRRQPDFLEGVRAVLVDKTRDPQFSPVPDPNVYRAVLQ